MPDRRPSSGHVCAGPERTTARPLMPPSSSAMRPRPGLTNVSLTSGVRRASCKSGRILKDNKRDDFEEIIAKTETPKGAFKNTRITDYTFLLLFNPELTDPNVVCGHFDPLAIKAVTPGEIRGVVIGLITRRR